MMQLLAHGVAGVLGPAAVVLATEAHVHAQGLAREGPAVQGPTLTHKTAIRNPAQVSMTIASFNCLSTCIDDLSSPKLNSLVPRLTPLLSNFQHPILKASCRNRAGKRWGCMPWVGPVWDR
jgi:hypothetical protein